MTVEIKKTERGFPYAEFLDGSGEECNVRISSALDDTGGQYKLWIGRSNLWVREFVKYGKGRSGKWFDVELPKDSIGSNRMHLTFENAKQLRDLLNAYIDSEGVTLEAKP